MVAGVGEEHQAMNEGMGTAVVELLDECRQHWRLLDCNNNRNMRRLRKIRLPKRLTLLPVLVDFVEPLLRVGVEANVEVALVQSCFLAHGFDYFDSALKVLRRSRLRTRVTRVVVEVIVFEELRWTGVSIIGHPKLQLF
jgi:hypothetical protein